MAWLGKTVTAGATQRGSWGKLGPYLAGAFLVILLLPGNLSRELTGDEPHYLLITHSLVFDGDVELKNNYLGQDYRAFFPKFLDEIPIKEGRRGEWYPLHDIGLPLLLAPAYWLGGRELVQVFLGLLAILLAGNLFCLCRDLGFDDRQAWYAWLAVVPTAPAVFYSLQVFPDLPAALLVLLAVRGLLTADRIGQVGALGLGGVLGFLPWLRMRFAPVSAIFLVPVLWKALRRPGLRVALLPVTASALLNLVYYHRLYGQALLRSGFHGGFNLNLEGFRGLAGLLLDGHAGLLVLAPVYLVGLAGFLAFPRVFGSATWAVTLVLVASWLEAGLYKYWWAGWCPQPARYLVVVLPLLGIPAARVMATLQGGWRLAALGMWLASLILPLASLIRPGAAYTGLWQWKVEQWTGRDLGGLVPCFSAKNLWFGTLGASPVPWLLLWTAGVMGVLVFLVRHARKVADLDPAAERETG